MSVTLQQGLYDLCEKNTGRHIDDAAFDAFRLEALQKTVTLASTESPFYKRLYADHGVGPEDIKSLADIAKLPFTYPKDISERPYSLLCTSQSKVEKPVTFFSSGSTGAKKRVFFSSADIGRILDFLPRGMNTVADRDDCRTLVFLQNSQGRGIGGILAQSLNAFGMQGWPCDLMQDVEEIMRLTLENHVNVWFGEAITILRATRILKQRYDLKSVGMKCIFITMTNIPASMTEYLQDAWGCRVSTHYGLTESGWGLAVDCDICSGYHYDELDHYIEIVDPESGEPLPYGQEGELVLTNLTRDCMPLIRYRTGDISTLSPSVCGSHLMTLGHIIRRREGAYILNGRELYPALFDEVLFENEQLLDYRIFADGERLIFEIEALDEKSFDGEELCKKLGGLECMEGLPLPLIKVLPCGALREFAFEKKRILPYETGEKNE